MAEVTLLRELMFWDSLLEKTSPTLKTALTLLAATWAMLLKVFFTRVVLL